MNRTPGRDDAATMIRKSLCALSIAILFVFASVGNAQAFGLSLFNLTINTPVESKSDAPANSSTEESESEKKDATDSAKLADKFLQDYFVTEQKTSLTAAGMTLPLVPSEVKGISTYFTTYHAGIDIRADVGSPVLSMHDGVVIENEYQAGGYGRYVVVSHTIGTQNVRSLYAHMKSASVHVGDTVRMGDKVGVVGMTGHTTGAHVHFETRLCDSDVQYYLCQATDPIRMLTKGLPNTIAKK